MQRPTKTAKLLIISLILVILTSACYLVGLKISNSALNFQAYSPTKLPSGITLQSHKTTVINQPNQKFKMVVIYTNTHNFFIGQEKATYEEYNSTMHSCNSKITNVTCKTLRSEQGQEYSIQTSFDTRNSKSFGQTISWQKDETRFWIDLRHDQVQKYQDESWADVIDSFVPTSYGEEFGEVSRHISG